MLTLAQELDVACWDLYGALGGAHSIERLREVGFAATDHLHFNRTGYELIGELLYDTLVRAALDQALNP
jgi:lysophospholipase L1-like esterase